MTNEIKKSLAAIVLLFIIQTLHGQDIQSEPQLFYGSDRLSTEVFVSVNVDTAFLDLIFFQKYPRKLFIDTLFQVKENESVFIGEKAKLIYLKGTHYIETLDTATIFNTKHKIKVKLDEESYIKYNDSHKNLAAWYMFYHELESLKDSVVISKYKDPKTIHLIDSLAKNCSYRIFKIELNKLFYY